MSVYKAVADAAQRADEQLTTFKRMIARKEAQLAAERPELNRRAKMKLKPKNRD